MREIFAGDDFRLTQIGERYYLILVAEDGEREAIPVRLGEVSEDDDMISVYALGNDEPLREIPREVIDAENGYPENYYDEDEQEGQTQEAPVPPEIPDNLAAMQALYNEIPWGELESTGESTQTFNLEVIVTRDFLHEWNLQTVTLVPPPAEAEQPGVLTTVFAWSIVGVSIVVFIMSLLWFVAKIRRG